MAKCSKCGGHLKRNEQPECDRWAPPLMFGVPRNAEADRRLEADLEAIREAERRAVKP